MIRFIIIFIPIILSAIAQIVLKAGVGSTNTTTGLTSFFINMFASPLVLVGLSLYGLGALLWLIVLSREDVSFAYVLAIFLSAIFLKEQITSGRILGALVIMIGIFIIARFG